jgi:hypothetical protein
MERLRDLAQKWGTRAETAQADYVREVSRPDVWQLWQQNAAAAGNTYNAAMQEVINTNRWGTVMSRTDPRIYGEMVKAKADRRVAGIRISAPRWAANYQPIAEAIDRVRPTLPTRGPRMSDANISRFMTTISAIHDAALRRRGVSASTATVAYGTPYFELPPVQQPAVQAQQTVSVIPRPQVGAYGGYGYQ